MNILDQRYFVIKFIDAVYSVFVDSKNPLRQVDILITADLKNIKIENISVGGHKIPVITLKDLRKMKKSSARPQDLLDVEMIDQKLKVMHEKK